MATARATDRWSPEGLVRLVSTAAPREAIEPVACGGKELVSLEWAYVLGSLDGSVRFARWVGLRGKGGGCCTYVVACGYTIRAPTDDTPYSWNILRTYTGGRLNFAG